VGRVLRVVMWAAVFAACAGIGAFVAAHTNPFPPGVEDPGVERPPSPTPSPSVVPTGPSWSGGAGAQTEHDLFVGGRCRSAWRLQLSFTVAAGGGVNGDGHARRKGDLRCDFPTAQAEAMTIPLRVGGHQHGSTLRLVLFAGSALPPGSSDFGGLTHTLVRFPPIPIKDGEATITRTVRIGDGDRGSYVAIYHVHLFCVRGC